MPPKRRTAPKKVVFKEGSPPRAVAPKPIYTTSGLTPASEAIHARMVASAKAVGNYRPTPEPEEFHQDMMDSEEAQQTTAHAEPSSCTTAPTSRSLPDWLPSPWVIKMHKKYKDEPRLIANPELINTTKRDYDEWMIAKEKEDEAALQTTSSTHIASNRALNLAPRTSVSSSIVPTASSDSDVDMTSSPESRTNSPRAFVPSNSSSHPPTTATTSSRTSRPKLPAVSKEERDMMTDAERAKLEEAEEDAELEDFSESDFPGPRGGFRRFLIPRGSDEQDAKGKGKIAKQNPGNDDSDESFDEDGNWKGAEKSERGYTRLGPPLHKGPLARGQKRGGPSYDSSALDAKLRSNDPDRPMGVTIAESDE